MPRPGGRPGDSEGMAEMAVASLASVDRQQLIDAIETIVDGFVLFDADDRLVTCNARYREIYALPAPVLVPGARLEDILRHGLAKGQYVEAIGHEEAWLARRLTAHRSGNAVHDQKLASGRWLRVVERTTRDGSRVGLHIDITEQQRQEQRLADIIAGTNAGTWEWNVLTGEARLNERWAEIIGYTLEELSPTSIETWLAFCHPDDLARSTAVLERHFSGEIPFYECEARMRHKAGHWVWVLDRGRVASWTADGRPEWVSGTHLEITERKRLERSLAEERDFLDRIMATSISAVAVLDGEGGVVFANAEAERLLGVSLDSLGRRRFDDAAWRITTVDGDPFRKADLPFERVMATGEPIHNVRHCVIGPDGRRRALSINAAPLAITDSSGGRVVCSIVDITEQRKAERALEHQEALLRGLFELSPVGIALNDFASGRYLDANAALLDALGYAKEELLALSYFAVTPEKYHALEAPQRRRLLAEGHYGPFEKEYIRKDGSHVPVLLNGILVRDQDGRPLIWSIVEDISERKAETARMLEAAQRDPLTGLANRRLFHERLAEALARARRSHDVGAVIVLDLDRFKPVNDRLGHSAGDAILIEAAARLTDCTRQTDTVGRLGGDEFAVVLETLAAPADAGLIASKMQRALSRPYEVAGERIELGVSIGSSIFLDQSGDPDELLHLADIAMYAAKRAGRRQRAAGADATILKA